MFDLLDAKLQGASSVSHVFCHIKIRNNKCSRG